MKRCRYRVFGTRIESDVLLPGLAVDRRATPPDVKLWLASNPSWVEHALTLPRDAYPQPDFFAGSRVVHTLGGEKLKFFHLAYADGTEFVISHAGDRVFGRWQSPFTLEYTVTYVMGPILGIVLRRRGWTCVHASAVAWNGRAVMFVGPPGAGKSTTAAAAVMRHGARMLTDDIVALRRSRGRYLVEPGQSWLRLWESSVRLLCRDEKALPLLTPNWDKRYLDATPRSSLAAPLERICFFGARTPREPATSLLAPVCPRDALVLLAANTYGSRFAHAAGRRTEFSTLSELARTVPAVIVPGDHGARPVDAMLEAVRENLESVNWRVACTRLPVTAK
jgi:hypothetical protein